jgi:hypothetical protein
MIRSNKVRSLAMCRRCRWLVLLTAAIFMFAACATESDAALVSRNILKSFFVPGAKPTSAQFSALIDSTVNILDDRYLLGLHSTGSTGAIRLDEGVTIGEDTSLVFGPAAGLDDLWAGHSGFMGVAFTDNSETHYGYFQLSAGVAGSTDVYPMFVEAFVYEDVARIPITTLAVTVPEPSMVALAAIWSIGVFGMRRRRAGC